MRSFSGREVGDSWGGSLFGSSSSSSSPRSAHSSREGGSGRRDPYYTPSPSSGVSSTPFGFLPGTRLNHDGSVRVHGGVGGGNRTSRSSFDDPGLVLDVESTISNQFYPQQREREEEGQGTTTTPIRVPPAPRKTPLVFSPSSPLFYRDSATPTQGSSLSSSSPQGSSKTKKNKTRKKELSQQPLSDPSTFPLDLVLSNGQVLKSRVDYLLRASPEFTTPTETETSRGSAGRSTPVAINNSSIASRLSKISRQNHPAPVTTTTTTTTKKTTKKSYASRKAKGERNVVVKPSVRSRPLKASELFNILHGQKGRDPTVSPPDSITSSFPKMSGAREVGEEDVIEEDEEDLRLASLQRRSMSPQSRAIALDFIQKKQAQPWFIGAPLPAHAKTEQQKQAVLQWRARKLEEANRRDLYDDQRL